MSKYGARREFIKEKGHYMYGIYKDGQLYDSCYLYGQKNAKLIVELLTLIDNYIIDHDNGIHQIMQILKIDKERGENGNVEYRVQSKR